MTSNGISSKMSLPSALPRAPRRRKSSSKRSWMLSPSVSISSSKPCRRRMKVSFSRCRGNYGRAPVPICTKRRTSTRKPCTTSDVERVASPPPEQSFDIGEFHLDIGRPAVVALACPRGAFHLTQKGVHLVRRQSPAGTNRMMAGHGGEHVIEPALKRGERAIIFTEHV